VGEENAPLPPVWKKARVIWLTFGLLPIPCSIAAAVHTERNGGTGSVWPMLGISAVFFWGFIVLPTILFIAGAMIEASKNPNAQ